MSLLTTDRGRNAVALSDLDDARVQAFFTQEAKLLDEWRLDEWLALMAPACRYIIPPLDLPNAKLGEALFLVADDRARLESRVRQLAGNTCWAEIPRSRTRRLVTNATIIERLEKEAVIGANFAIWRFQLDIIDTYVGRYVYVLEDGPTGPLIRERKAILDLETLRPHGKISIIL